MSAWGECMAQFSWAAFGLRSAGTMLQLYGFVVVAWRLLGMRSRLGGTPLRRLVADELKKLWYRLTRQSVGYGRIFGAQLEVPAPPRPDPFEPPDMGTNDAERFRAIEHHLTVLDEQLSTLRAAIKRQQDATAADKPRNRDEQREQRAAELAGVKRETWAVFAFIVGTMIANWPDAITCLPSVIGGG